MKKLFLIALLPLAGCAGNLRLLEDGRAHQGTWSGTSKTMEASIDGVKYSGPFYVNDTPVVGTSFVGTRAVTTVGVAGNDNVTAVLSSPDGKVLRCSFRASSGRGQGQCSNNSGKVYDLIIGS